MNFPTRLFTLGCLIGWSNAAHAFEFQTGPYVGVLIPSSAHELYDTERATQAPYATAPEFGWRAGIFPLGFVGAEVEGELSPTATDAGSALLGGWRGSFVGRLPLGKVRPFVLLGAGQVGLSSADAVQGNDLDGALHWGLGADYRVLDHFTARLDFRDVITRHVGQSTTPAHIFEINASFNWIYNPAPDRDKDKFADAKDACPDVAGVAPDGCPADSDRDGLTDSVDACPDSPESKNSIQDEDGCPEGDRDADTVVDPVDACPDTADVLQGIRGDNGCPPTDQDGDEVLDVRDLCIHQPETVNGLDDSDGCPDELTADVPLAIPGLLFEHDSAQIVDPSVLDIQVATLKAHPEWKVKIIGHTDNTGTEAHNDKLAKARAKAVFDVLVGKGIPKKQLSMEGRGAKEPVASNDTPEGQAQNRRIVFEVQP